MTTYVTGAAYGLGLGAGTLLLPIQAHDAGLSLAQIGTLAAISALAQIAARLSMARVMDRVAEHALVLSSAALLAASFLTVVLSDSAVAITSAFVLHGLSRAFFWTGYQASAVHASGTVTRSVARALLMVNAGTVGGTVVAGIVAEYSMAGALLAGSLVSLTALALSSRMPRWPIPHRESQASPRLWRHPQVLIGSIASGSAGAWRALQGSYVPVILLRLGYESATVGVLVAFATAVSMLSAASLMFLGQDNPRRYLMGALLAVALGTAALPVGTSVIVAGTVLMIGSLGSGWAQVLGTSYAVSHVPLAYRGTAVAVTGTARAVSMFASPLVVAGCLVIVPMAGAMAMLGGLLSLPAAVLVLTRDRGVQDG